MKNKKYLYYTTTLLLKNKVHIGHKKWNSQTTRYLFGI